MGFFTPPTQDTVPPIDAKRQGLGWRLMRHYGQRREGRNVYILSNSTATENDPWWINPGDPTVVRTFHGGRVDPYQVDAEEEAILEAAGFTVTDFVLDLDGTAGTFASTPDSAALSITGDIDIRAKVAADDWTPASQDRGIVAKWVSASNHSYLLALTMTGALRLYTSTDGVSTAVSQTSDVVTGFADGSTHWVRATLDIDNGAGNGDVKFYTSADGTTWTQLGTTRTRTGTAAIFDGVGAVSIGAYNNGAGGLHAINVYYAEIRNGIDGTVVASFDADDFDLGAGDGDGAYDSQGNRWTLHGNAVIE